MSTAPYQTPFDRLGGEAGVGRLVDTFYDVVETVREGAPLRVLHDRGKGLAHAREAQFLFMSGFLGGPQVYAERFGHTNVRQMHGHLEIGEAEAASWLACMDMALERTADVETAAVDGGVHAGCASVAGRASATLVLTTRYRSPSPGLTRSSFRRHQKKTPGSSPGEVSVR